jgi:hypothetical protein
MRSREFSEWARNEMPEALLLSRAEILCVAEVYNIAARLRRRFTFLYEPGLYGSLTTF